jgi:hypothetical protein
VSRVYITILYIHPSFDCRYIRGLLRMPFYSDLGIIKIAALFSVTVPGEVAYLSQHTHQIRFYRVWRG